MDRAFFMLHYIYLTANRKNTISEEMVFFGETLVPKGFLRVWHPMIPTGLEPATSTLSI
ncbi:hypothetical protein [Paenisporosarcina sp.]|uniref:hypothetical protein n=1 Tax=Paenisporosarcina sp. TaxID=1932001 RepID=UPI003C7420DF